MGIKFTKTQRQVIEKRGCSILVSAAAGSGKTAVLVERIVEMVCDQDNPVDIDRLLVVTFTNAAAAQMRERISRALSERLLLDPENEHLQRQTTLLYNAQITTIDSFCLFVLRNQFHTIGLDPGFRIAEEGELKLLRSDVLSRVLEDAYAKQAPAFLHCMEYFSAGSRDEAVEKEILRLYDFAMSMPFPEEWLAARKEDYRLRPAQESGAENSGQARESGQAEESGLEQNQGEAFCDPLALPWADSLLAHVRLVLAGCVENLEAACRLCEESDGPYFYAPLLEQEREMTEGLLRMCGGAGEITDYDCLCGAFAAISFARLPSKKDDSVQAAKRENAKELRNGVKETLSALREKFFAGNAAQVCRQMEACGAAAKTLVELTLAFKEAFDLAKRDKNILDFVDIEHFALQALLRRTPDGYEPTETALAYRSRFHEILIDEYQDSNMVQEYLLSCISGEAEGRYNRFMVGDVKQSIYKFRLARPELFLEKLYAYEQEGAHTGRIDLHQNFRSRTEVIDSVNAVFERLMGEEAGGIVYDERAALYPGAVYPKKEGAALAGDANVTELLLFQEQKADAAQAGANAGEAAQTAAQAGANANEAAQTAAQAGANANEAPQPTAKEQEAYGVAARIKTLLREFHVTDKETGRLRKAAFRDIVILLRSLKGWDEVFKRVLEEEGIPVHVTSTTGYFAASEVQELLHFLRILDNPLQDIPLYGVLHTYLGGFSEEEIALVRAACPKKKYLYDALVVCAGGMADAGAVENGTGGMDLTNIVNETPAETQQKTGMGRAAGAVQTDAGKVVLTDVVNETLQAKISAFLDKIAAYRKMAVYLSVHELLQTLLRETGYVHYVAARPEGGRRRANVEMLLVKAADYEKTGSFGLYHFLRYMEQLEKYEVDYGEAVMQDENADVVRIMSIHKSKGLEFPICFVSGLSSDFRKKETAGILAVDMDMGIGVDYVDPDRRVKSKNLRKNVIGVKLKKDSLAEELRILYVAMTRAEEKLILTGVVKSEKKLLASLQSLRRRKTRLLSYNALMEQNSFLTLLLSALAGNHCMDGFYESYGIEPDSESPEYAADLAVDVKLTDWDNAMEKKLEETILGADAKKRLLSAAVSGKEEEALMTKLSQRFSYTYPHESLRNLYTKTTVSELKKAGMQEETEAFASLYEERPIVPYLPKFIEADGHVSGSMRGSAFHKAMELFDFTKLTREVNDDGQAAGALLRKELARMREEGRLSDAYYGALSVPKLSAFLTSRAAFRMGEAARAGKLFKEQPFVMGLPANRLGESFSSEETVLIQGIIDVFFEEEDGYVVLDYKTDAVDAPEELVKRYGVQLAYYSEALEQIFGYEPGAGGKPVKERIIYSFKLGQEITTAPSN